MVRTAGRVEANTIGRPNLDGSGADQNFITGVLLPTGVAVDSAHVYRGDGGTRTIGLANLDGTGANPSFITSTAPPQGVAVDAGTPLGGPPPPKTADLVAAVNALGLPHGIERSLLAKLAAAQQSVDAHQTAAACGPLSAFINELRAQSGKKLDAADAAGLIDDAGTVRNSLGCGSG
jgi:hypothetical protein